MKSPVAMTFKMDSSPFAQNDTIFRMSSRWREPVLRLAVPDFGGQVGPFMSFRRRFQLAPSHKAMVSPAFKTLILVILIGNDADINERAAFSHKLFALQSYRTRGIQGRM
jgi:hypothetical protein